MSNWPKKLLLETAEIVMTRVKPFEGTRRYVATGGLDGGELVLSEDVDFKSKPSRADLVAKRGDVLFARMQATNKVTLITDQTEDCIWSTGFVTLRSKPCLSSRYLLHYLASPLFQTLKDAHCTGATQKSLPNDGLKKITIPLPPISEQERIANLLDKANELRKLRGQANGRTTNLIPALFYEMFGDPEINPKNWPIRRTGDLMVACDYGTSHKANDQGRGIVVLRMGNVTSGGELDLSDIKAVELSDDELAKQLLQPSDVLFNRTNSRELVGKTGLWDGRIEAVAASYFIRVRFNPNVEHPQHFTTFMNLPTMKHRLAKIARGAVGQANINSKELRSIELPVPPILVQKEFANRVSEIRSMQAEQTASRKRLDDLFQSMLHRAFKGEL